FHVSRHIAAHSTLRAVTPSRQLIHDSVAVTRRNALPPAPSRATAVFAFFAPPPTLVHSQLPGREYACGASACRYDRPPGGRLIESGSGATSTDAQGILDRLRVRLGIAGVLVQWVHRQRERGERVPQARGNAEPQPAAGWRDERLDQEPGRIDADGWKRVDGALLLSPSDRGLFPARRGRDREPRGHRVQLRDGLRARDGRRVRPPRRRD